MGKNVPGGRTPPSMLPVRFPSRAAIYAAGDVGLMFFLFRMAFWLGLVLILLPSGSSERPAPATEVNASQAISAASATVGDLRQFCIRQPDACTVGSHVATQLGYKAQAGAKMLYEFLTEALASKDSSKDKDATRDAPKVTGALFSGSVTPAGKSSADQASQN